MKFEGQRPEEKVIFILKKHPAVLFRPLLFLTLLTILPVFAFVYFKFSWPFSYTFFFWLIVGGSYAIKIYYCFANSKLILTSERLIDINQKGIFHKTVSEISLEKIQDASFEIKGFWPSMWDYGTIYIQVAGAQEKMNFSCIEEPNKIQACIIEAIKKGMKSEIDNKNEDIKDNQTIIKQGESKKIRSIEEIKKIKKNIKSDPVVEEKKSNFWD